MGWRKIQQDTFRFSCLLFDDYSIDLPSHSLEKYSHLEVNAMQFYKNPLMIPLGGDDSHERFVREHL
jgi:hypothetical protein